VPSQRRYPRVARVNELLREVLADAIERLDDDRLVMATVTGVTADPDLRHATVWMASLAGDAGLALAEHRPQLQAAIARQVRMKRTPELAFKADPAVASGSRVEEIIRGLPRAEEVGDE
jgi:ribosome-binding factor A